MSRARAAAAAVLMAACGVVVAARILVRAIDEMTTFPAGGAR